LIDPDPDTVLTALNTALLLDPAVGTRFCTAVFGVLEPHEKDGFTVTVATGGPRRSTTCAANPR
jgi:sigma-B regulation protein RsbU (phosphoserine phosphatase)